MTADAITDFIKDRIGVDVANCTKLKTKHESYSSFCFEVPAGEFDGVFASEEWPPGLLLKPFRGDPLLGATVSVDPTESTKNA
jgi:hypothetical protein